MPLSQNPKPATGELRADGLVFRVQPDGASVALVGWYGDKLSADVVVPARVSSGNDLFEVKALGVLDAEGHCEPLFKGSEAKSLSIPATVKEIAEGALSDCDTLSRVIVSDDNKTYSSFDGMLFSKDLSDLLLVPEGKESIAFLPDSTATVPASAFSRCQRLQAVQVGEGCAAFSARDGMLYTKDMKTLVTCPPGAGSAVVIPQGVEAIGSGAFSGCALSSLTVLGDVREISADAFDDAAKSATVALPKGSDKAAWESAGFSNFSVPAAPGDTSTPDQGNPEAPEGESGSPQSGLSFEVLSDYTLAASWAGGDAPATFEIPATAEVGGASYRVGTIASAGFSNLAGLESVVLPAGLSSIGEAAFAGCANLSTVEIPDGVTSIGERAFEATALTEAWLPESVATVGSRAFAACGSLVRVVALGTPEVAPDALAECSGVSVYCPAGSEDSWNPGIPAAGNSVLPYAATLAAEPLALTAGESASILEGGELLAPEPVEASYSYSAKPLSVDSDGSATGKSEGATDVAVALTLDGIELTRASRSVEVASGEAQPAMINETATLMSSAYLAGARAAAAPISVTAPIAVVFGGAGYNVSSPQTSVTAPVTFHNNSGVKMRIASLTTIDDGAEQVLEANTGSLASLNIFSLNPGTASSGGANFGYASSNVPLPAGSFDVPAGGTLDCTYCLDLSGATVRADAADGASTVQGLAKVKYTFAAVGMGSGTGSESASFYLKDKTRNQVYSLAEVKAHADFIASGNAECKAAYEAFMADESRYECKTKWGGVTYDVRVIGINHDVKTSGGKAGLTFQFKNLLDTKAPMNGSDTNTGGWGSSALRTSMNSDAIWNTVPTDLQSVIVEVSKGYTASSDTGATVVYSPDKLFIASYHELTGSIYSNWASYSWLVGEGAQYEFYQGKSINNWNDNAILKKAPQSSPSMFDYWWERSVGPNNSLYFVDVNPSGDPGRMYSASTPIGVCPCFCL